MSVPEPILFTKLIDALLDESKPFHPRYLHRFSDLEPADARLLAEAWPKVSLRRRESLLEDLEELHIADDLLRFEEVGRLALKDNQSGVRLRAIRILNEYEIVDLIPTFIQLAEQDPNVNVRAEAAAALAAFVYLGEVEDIAPSRLALVEECLLRLNNSNEPSVIRRNALEALGYSSRREVPGLIEKAYFSNDIDWLISALTAMGRSANPRWIAQVLKMLDHKRPEVRAEAASAAGELEVRSAAPRLLELLEDPNLDVRMASIWSLSQVGGEGVRQALEDLLESTEDDEEVSQIDNALENLEFTEEMKELSLLEIPEEDDESGTSSDDDHDESFNQLISEDEED